MPVTLPDPNNVRYMAAMQQGLTGPDLANAAGIPVPQGNSPPVVSPAPNMVPPTWSPAAANYVRPAPGGVGGEDMSGFWRQFEANTANMPIQQAQAAAQAAMQYQAQRGYQNDLQSGMSADQALAKWAPMMFGKPGGGLGGVSGMMKAVQPQPNYNFVPGDATMPATFQAPGKEPKIVPRSAMPPVIKPLEVMTVGNSTVFRDPVTGVFKLSAGSDFTREEKMKMIGAIPAMAQKLTLMPEEDPRYQMTKDALDLYVQLQREVQAEGSGSAPVAAPEPAKGETKKRYQYDQKEKRVIFK